MKLNLLIIILFILLIGYNNVSGSKTIFYDDFENWSGWQNYSSGTVSQSSEQSYSGTYSLKKSDNNDPNGGYKEIGKVIGRDIIVSGWIYRPTPYNGGRWDRIGIENGSFDGYSTKIHNNNYISIDKRTGGSATEISNKKLRLNKIPLIIECISVSIFFNNIF